MNKFVLLIILLVGNIYPATSYAKISKVDDFVQNVQKSDTARLKYMIWNVYDATLFTPNGDYKSDSPFALELKYLVDLKGDKIAERSIVEMRKQGFLNEEKLNQWEEKMKEIFPNVEKGSSITGIRDSKGNAIFYKNEKLIGKFEDTEFTKNFFDIWLSPKTSEPEMREQLLGLK